MRSLILRNANALNNRNWNPLDDFENLVNRFFSSYQPYSGEEGMIQMPIELIERDDNFILKVMTPGIKKENLNIEVSEDHVSISGICKVEYEENKDLIHRSEFCKGNFTRCVSLPQKIDNSKSKADYKDGVLTLTLPKSEKETSKVTKLSL